MEEMKRSNNDADDSQMMQSCHEIMFNQSCSIQVSNSKYPNKMEDMEASRHFGHILLDLEPDKVLWVCPWELMPEPLCRAWLCIVGSKDL